MSVVEDACIGVAIVKCRCFAVFIYQQFSVCVPLMSHVQLVLGNYDIQISILSIVLNCEWGLSVSQEALITSVSGTKGEPGTGQYYVGNA